MVKITKSAKRFMTRHRNNSIKIRTLIINVINLAVRYFRFLSLRTKLKNGSRRGVFIQIGAGAGDLDVRAGSKDGFSQLVKSLDRSLISKVVLVEPNRLNLPLLTKSWDNFQCVEIFNLAITPKIHNLSECKIYWSYLGAPNFQTASIDPNHVLKHYPTQRIEDLQFMESDCISLDKFLGRFANEHIKLLGLDIEGIDDRVILETNFREYDIDLISFEFIHMDKRLHDVKNHLEICGF